MYMMEPSRLKEYPKGSTKLTMRLLHPNLSRPMIVLGNADSELAVLNARITGSLMCDKSL